jgi:hypothetical protein
MSDKQRKLEISGFGLVDVAVLETAMHLSPILFGALPAPVVTAAAPQSPCGAYGRIGVGGPLVPGCCTGDPLITSVQSGVCQGIASPAVGNGSETSIAFAAAGSTSGPTSGHLVVAFNAQGAPDSLGWAFSTDQGRTWQRRNKHNGGALGGAVASPMTPFNSYRGDPSIVALGSSGMVAMVTLADTQPQQPPPTPPPLAAPLEVGVSGNPAAADATLWLHPLGGGVSGSPEPLHPRDRGVSVDDARMGSCRFTWTPILAGERPGGASSGNRVPIRSGPRSCRVWTP